MKFYKKELIDLTKSWAVISFIFYISGSRTLYSFLVSSIIVGMAFIFHELSHKYLAQRYGLNVKYRSFDGMLLLSLLLSLIGLIFLAPGAVMIRSEGSDKIRMGRIASAGPLSNIIMGILFFLSYLYFSYNFLIYGFYINSFIALFNMIPVFMFDGKKVLSWNKSVFYLLLIVSFGMFLYSSYLMN